MKKYLYFPALAALLMLAGCTADELDEANGLVPLSLSAEIQAEEVTRAGTSLLNSFSNETLGINLTNCINSSGAALTTTTYTVGTGFAEQPYISAGQTATVTGYYPASAASATSFSVSDNQTSDANYKASDLMFAAAQSATKASSSPTLTFAHKMAKLIVNVMAASGVSSITSVTLNNISRTIGWTASTGTLGDLSSSGDITMSNNGAALIPPQTTSESNNFLTIVTNAGTAIYKLGKQFAGGSVYTININVGLTNIGTSTTITGWTGSGTVTVQPTVTNAPAGAVAVDLGLYVGGGSSGKKLYWANMNVGATKVTGYGTYFAWGETSGYTVNPDTNADDVTTNYKTIFNRYTYAWCNVAYSSITKYSNNASYWDNNINSDTPDGKTQLELGDDAARANWGGKWRMPTKDEFDALFALTKEWVSDYEGTGVAGYKFTGNGNSIFLPAAGYRYNSSFNNQGSYGGFWSSALNADDPSYACSLDFNSIGAGVNFFDRCYGQSVRAVQSE